MGLKIIGTGLSRTGTTTIRKVLEELGFGPCYNSSELFTHPRGIEFWEALEKGKTVDFDTFFRDYNAISGFPGYLFAREILEKYPNAKVILSVRDPEDWYDDISNTVFQTGPSHVNKAYAKEAGKIDPYLADCISRIHALQTRNLEDGFFEGRFADRNYAVQRYVQWNEDVKKKFPTDQLLVYQIKEGADWPPFCEFLGVPVPEKPFPHLNPPEVFHNRSTSGFLDKLLESEGL
jgi:hypothetical protein